MNLLRKKILGTGCALGLAALHLSAQGATPFGNLPLWFETGCSRTDGGARFVAHGSSSEFLIAPAQATFVLRKADGQTAACTMQFVGAKAGGQISGDAELTGKINHLVGNNPARWRTGVPTFARVRVEDIYPGINVVYYGNQRQLEYDFDLAAGVNPNAIAIRFDGAEKISVNAQDELVVSLNGGEIVQHRPVAYQTIHGQRHEVVTGYKVVDAHTATFAVGTYDHVQPLVIDPVLSYSTYFGGNYGEIAHAVIVDNNGYAYIAGETLSTAFTNGITTAGAYQTNFHGGSYNGDAFVAKFDAVTGTNLSYLTYLGGNDDETALGLAVDTSGNAYITGWTMSTNFPTTNAGALFTHIAGKANPVTKEFWSDAFVSELNTNGSALIYSTYLGGNYPDIGNAIAVDSVGNAYIAGYTYSTNLPVTAGAYQHHLGCTNSLYGNINQNGFVAEIGADGTNFVTGSTNYYYCSYFGGTNYDRATGIALDSANNVYVTGYTGSTNFPTTNALPAFKHLNGATNATPSYDAFVSKFSPGFTNLIYSTFLGGTNNDQATGIAVDSGGNAYVVGSTVSTNFPYQPAAGLTISTNLTSFVHTNANGYVVATNAFLTQIQWNGTNTSIGYSVMFGGRGNDVATAVALAPDGNVFVTGNASSTNFPIVNVTTNSGFLRPTNSGLSDAFVIAFTNNASQIIYSTYLGGSDNDYAYGIAVDPLDAVYVVGQTLSTNFPTLNARQKTRDGANDTFLAKISIAPTDAPRLVIRPPTTPPVSPKLAGARAGSPNVTLAWQMFPPTYGVESSTNPSSTNGWTAVPQSPVYYSNGWYGITLPTTNALQFFRLQRP